ncbi:MAG: hypothetical protein LUC44_06170 [Prevotellaceae bacterium]|nr:hypothetical protein [Prevotellaceae bacterium]
MKRDLFWLVLMIVQALTGVLVTFVGALNAVRSLMAGGHAALAVIFAVMAAAGAAFIHATYKEVTDADF